jgi:hypothetical protein
MTIQEAAQHVTNELDRVGRKLTLEEWSDLCEEVAGIADAKRDAAVQELERLEKQAG